MKFIKYFDLHNNYNSYITSENVNLPNLSYCEDENETHLNPKKENRLICYYNVTEINENWGTRIFDYYEADCDAAHAFSKIELDNNIIISPEELDNSMGYYNLSLGEHIIKFTLLDNTLYNLFFYDVPTLTKVIIPANVVTIYTGVFDYCQNLEQIICYITEPSIVSNIFNNYTSQGYFNNNFKLYVPADCVNAYKEEFGDAETYGNLANVIYPIS